MSHHVISIPRTLRIRLPQAKRIDFVEAASLGKGIHSTQLSRMLINVDNKMMISQRKFENFLSMKWSGPMVQHYCQGNR